MILLSTEAAIYGGLSVTVVHREKISSTGRSHWQLHQRGNSGHETGRSKVTRGAHDSSSTKKGIHSIREVHVPQDANEKWVSTVKTDSTHPPKGLFTKKAATIASSLASKRASPKGPQSGMRILNYFINRAGSGLSALRRAELERAKSLLSKRLRKRRARQKPGPQAR